MSQKVRVRFAPSPTGPLHIGGVRTALYNYLFAKQQGGDFILRIEDTDTQRFVPGAEDYIVAAFQWLGLAFDEGPHIGGAYGPYRQSDRKAIYKDYVDILLAGQAAYIAFDTPAQLEAKRAELANFQYDASTRGSMCNSLTLSADEVVQRIQAGEQYVVRFKVAPNQEVLVKDLIRGEVRIQSSVLDDKVLFKSADQLPTYHLANIVDDHLMAISHVIRGEEWLPSAPLHVLLYRAFGWEESMPQFAHLPLLLKPDGKGKLSKRDGDRLGFPVFPIEWIDPKGEETYMGYRESGYMPQAVNNFLALLGWNPGTEVEVMQLEELIQQFSLDRCSKSGAQFDYEKGKWFNHQYLQLTSNADIAALYMPLLLDKGINPSLPYVETVVGLVKERVNFVKELWEQSAFFFVAPTAYDDKAVKKRWKAESPRQMAELMAVLENETDFSAGSQEEVVKKWIEANEYHLGNVMNAFRLAIVGELKGPHIFAITATIGQTETIERLAKSIQNISND